MIINYQFDDVSLFVRDRYSSRLSALIATANELGEEVTVAERYSPKSGGFIISIQVGGNTQSTNDFYLLKDVLEKMGGKLSPITLINDVEFRGLFDK